jgi:curved DNA-binding protein CbpA
MANKLIQNLAGIQSRAGGNDIHDVISLSPEFAVSGGPYAYFLRQRNKKLVVRIPANVRDGQRIRLPGMGQEGLKGGEKGDLYLKIKIHVPMVQKIKAFIGLKNV